LGIHKETCEGMVVYQALFGDFNTYVLPLTKFINEFQYAISNIQNPMNQISSDKITGYDDSIKSAQSVSYKNSEGKSINEKADTARTSENRNYDINIAGKEDENHRISDEVSKVKEKSEIKEYRLIENENVKDDKNRDETIDKIIKAEKIKNETVKNDNIIDENTKNEKQYNILIRFLDADSYSEKLEIITTNIKAIDDKMINNMAASIDLTIEEGALEQRIQELIYCLKQMSRFEDRRLRNN